MVKYCLNRYKTQEMSDKAADAFLPTLNSIADWFVTNKRLEKLDNAVFFNYDIDFDDKDSDIVTFFSDDLDLNTIDLNNINFDEQDPETIINVRLMAWCNRNKQGKACKKEISKELMAVASHPTRWWDLCMSEYKLFLIDEN